MFTTCAEKMHDKVCQKRWRCAPPFFDNLEKTEGGLNNPPPRRAKVKSSFLASSTCSDNSCNLGHLFATGRSSGAISQRGPSVRVCGTVQLPRSASCQSDIGLSAGGGCSSSPKVRLRHRLTRPTPPRPTLGTQCCHNK